MKTYQYSHLLPILDQVIADEEVKALPELVTNIEQLRQSILANENGQTAAQIKALNQMLVLYMLSHHDNYPHGIQPLVNALRQIEHTNK